jgi:cyclic pyranopterin phosphate synthase
MEITAALEGLRNVPESSQVTVYTDSQYLFGCMSRGWERKANRDLFEQLDHEATRRQVSWTWIDQSDYNQYQKEAHNTALKLASGKPQGQRENRSQESSHLTHMDESGRPRMVDVSAKPDTVREATAKCRVKMKAETFNLIKQGGIAKGDVLPVAQLAGIMGAKQTPYLIPLCHPLLLGEIKVDFALDETGHTIEITASVKSTGKTGVEMEALTAAAVAALTIYDMCKAVDRTITIDNLRMTRKSGGKSGTIEIP